MRREATPSGGARRRGIGSVVVTDPRGGAIRILVTPLSLSWLVLGCGGEPGLDATTIATLSSTSTTEIASSGTSSGDQTTTVGESSTNGETGDAPPPFSCELPAASPTLDPQHWLHPAEPIAGQTLTIALATSVVEPTDAPPLVAELTNSAGTELVDDYTIVGGQTLYYISLPGLEAGANCVVVRNAEAVELAFEVMAADPGAGVPRGEGVWKVTQNHQWRCDEQPTFGNLLHIRVSEADGSPVEGATVHLAFTDDTVHPVGPDEAEDFESSMHPKTMMTGADGRAELFTPWGEGIRSPVDSKPGLAVYRVWVEGGASDVATEITTGLWEANYDGCNYCNEYAINTWGHWSYTVEFQRAPDASEVCEVGTDHAGQEACGFTHFFHHPSRPGCVPVAPE